MNDYVFLLIENAEDQDTDGNWQDIAPTRRQVFAKLKAKYNSKYFSSMRLGYKEITVFDLAVCDYQNESIVEYQGYRYRVKRANQKSVDTIELRCERSKN